MDADDLQLLRSGDETAFRRFVEHHEARVYAFALRLSGDPTTAEDVAQETFVKAWRGVAGFRGDSTLETWLLGIVVRTARRHWRGEIRRRRREAHHGPAERSGTGVDAMLDLEAALRHLPPRVRAAVVLVCIEGRSHAEAGRMMGTAEGTVKAQVHRGRQLLRERLDR